MRSFASVLGAYYRALVAEGIPLELVTELIQDYAEEYLGSSDD